MEKLKRQIEKHDQETQRARAAVNDAQTALDAAITALADTDNDKAQAAVTRARQAHTAASDRLTALQRRRELLQSDLDAALAVADRKSKNDRLQVLLGEIEAAQRRSWALLGAMKFEGAHRDERLRQMHREARISAAAARDAEKEAAEIAADLGIDVAGMLTGISTNSPTVDEIRAALSDFGVSDSFHKWTIEESQQHAQPVIP